MRISCPIIQCKRDVLYCIYRCPEMANCDSYFQHYDAICEMEVKEFYLTKYGIPTLPIPTLLLKRQKAEAKKAKQAKKDALIPKKNWDKCAPKESKHKKKENLPTKRTRRTKAEMEAFRASSTFISEMVPATPIVVPVKKQGRPKKITIATLATFF